MTITDTTFLAELWALERTRDLALEIADRSYAEYAAQITIEIEGEQNDTRPIVARTKGYDHE